METLDEVQQRTKDEYGLKAAGLLSGTEKLFMLFGLKLGHLMFGASETLSKSLQEMDTTIQETIGAVKLANRFYKRQRTDQAFELFYTDVLDTARKHEIGDTQLPRFRRAPTRFDSCSSMENAKRIYIYTYIYIYIDT